MNLHHNKDAFLVLISNVSDRIGIRTDIIEKDYYITLLLWELSQKQDELPAYFKGGTALYKAMKSLNRFSEDIDLTVETKDCSNSQGKKRLETATNKYESLLRTKDKTKEENHKGSITAVYEYEPITLVDSADALQRFGHVKIEATSFTISEPYETLEIEPLIYTSASEEEQQILKNQFHVSPFNVKTIKMERIFADKILAAEFYYQRNDLFDVSKHLYDLTIMMNQEKIKSMLGNSEILAEMLMYKRMEEKVRSGSDLSEKTFEEFTLFVSMADDHHLKDIFMQMQSVYVFDEKDILCFESVCKTMQNLNQILLNLDEGLEIKQTHNFGLTML